MTADSGLLDGRLSVLVPRVLYPRRGGGGLLENDSAVERWSNGPMLRLPAR